MTGFRLSWRVESPAAMMATMNLPGSKIQTPGLGKSTFTQGYFEANLTYKATLQFPSDLVKQVGSGALVVELKVDTTKEAEGIYSVTIMCELETLQLSF